MADVRPFRAVRYARPTAGVTAPPYDVIDDGSLAALRGRDPHNVVHLTLEPDGEVAGRRYREWVAAGVLVREDDEAVWWVEQESVGPDGVARRRDGIVASLRVEPYETGSVLPHERTHAGPIEGRLRLVRAAGAQLEPIFLLYEGPAPLIRPAGAPTIEVDGTRLWRIAGDPGVHEHFRSRQLLIADGHHRYETTLALAAGGGGNRLPVVLVSTSDPGFEIFPTHRLFAGRPDVDPPGEPTGSLAEALEALDADGADPLLVFHRRDETRLVRPTDGELDVELVERFGHDGLAYTPDRDEAVRRVSEGAADAAFLLRPPRIEDVLSRARAGVPLPPKSTYFFPKLLSGLLFHPLDP